ncbi:UNVERIFIED_CONTAM: hypothetical protein HDU68_010306, partial [Siphonaria sp. JEL0065]
MLASNDVKHFAETSGNNASPEDEQSQIREYEVSCLDYSYLPTAKDKKELVNLLAVLRSGREGSYPDLEIAFEMRILELDPKHVFSYKLNQPQKPPTMTEIQKEQLEFASWEQSIKSADASLRDTAGKVPLRKKDSAVSVRGSLDAVLVSTTATTNKDTAETENDNRESSSASSYSSNSSDASDSDSDDSDANQSDSHQNSNSTSDAATTASRRPRSILKTATPPNGSPEGKNLHVRFQDEVEAAARELERIKRKQEKRQRQVELHLAHPVTEGKSKKKSHGKKKNKKSTNAVVSGLSDTEGVVGGTTGATANNFVTAKKSGGILIQEVDSLEEQGSTPASTVAETSAAATKASSRIKSYDYRSWEKFDVDAELEKLESEEHTSTATRINPLTTTNPKDKPTANIPSIQQDIPLDDQVVVSRLAESEKQKGNESFKAKELNEALRYYTRSLQIKPQVQVYNNRSLVYLKLEQYEKAEMDATSAITLSSSSTLERNTPTDSFKSYLRRALSRSKRGNLVNSLCDLEKCLALFPTNQEAVSLKKEVLAKLRDVEGDNADDILVGAGLLSGGSANRNKSGIKIIEVEEEEEEEEEIEDEIVTPFGKSCGGASKPVTTAANASGPSEKSKGKERATFAAPVEEVVEELSHEEIVEREQVRRQAIMEAWKEQVGGELKKRPGYACGSGVSKEEKVQTFGKILKDESKEAKQKTVEIVEVDFDSDDEADEEAVVETVQAVVETTRGNGPKSTATINLSKSDTKEKEKEIPGIADANANKNGDAKSTLGEAEEVEFAKVSNKETSAIPPAIPPAPTTSYEFEGAWKVLKSNPIEWETYVKAMEPQTIPKLLANVGNPSIVLDIFIAMNQFVKDEPGHVKKILEEMKKIPRLTMLLKLFSRKEKA